MLQLTKIEIMTLDETVEKIGLEIGHCILYSKFNTDFAISCQEIIAGISRSVRFRPMFHDIKHPGLSSDPEALEARLSAGCDRNEPNYKRRK